MAVAVLDDWIGQTAGSPGGSLTISAGTAGGRVLWIVYFQEGGTKVYTSMTVGTVAATGELIEESPDTSGTHIWSWFWDEAAIASMTGTTVSFSFTGTATKHDFDYIVFEGALDGAEYATSTSSSGANNSSITNDATASTADDFFAIAINRSASARTVDAYENLTEGWQYNVDYTLAVADGAGGDDTETLTGDGFSGDWFTQMIHMKAGAASNPPMMNRMMQEGHSNG